MNKWSEEDEKYEKWKTAKISTKSRPVDIKRFTNGRLIQCGKGKGHNSFIAFMTNEKGKIVPGLNTKKLSVSQSEDLKLLLELVQSFDDNGRWRDL